MSIKRYIIIQENYIANVAREVNKYIALGYVPFGNPLFISGKSTSNGTHDSFMQAMTLEEEDEKDTQIL